MAFTQQETCEFIAEHASALARLATNADLEALSYLLSMAQLEADNKAIELRKLKNAA